jgi:hypothetical protein
VGTPALLLGWRYRHRYSLPLLLRRGRWGFVTAVAGVFRLCEASDGTSRGTKNHPGNLGISKAAGVVDV